MIAVFTVVGIITVGALASCAVIYAVIFLGDVWSKVKAYHVSRTLESRLEAAKAHIVQLTFENQALAAEVVELKTKTGEPYR